MLPQVGKAVQNVPNSICCFFNLQVFYAEAIKKIPGNGKHPYSRKNHLELFRQIEFRNDLINLFLIDRIEFAEFACQQKAFRGKFTNFKTVKCFKK